MNLTVQNGALQVLVEMVGCDGINSLQETLCNVSAKILSVPCIHLNIFSKEFPQ